MVDPTANQLEHKRTQTLYRQLPVALAGNMFVAAITIVLLWQTDNNRISLIWSTLLVLSLVIRYVDYRRVHVHDKHRHMVPERQLLRYGAGSCLTGFLWGLLALHALFALPHSFVPLVLMVLAGLAAGSLATSAVSIRSFLAFVLPSILPAACVLIMWQDPVYRLLGLLTLVYLLLITVAMVRLNRLIIQSLINRFRNEQLLVRLREEQLQTTELNRKLELDIEKRKQVETEKEQVILKLRQALDQVHTLSGLIPICASCKSVRDDQGYWNRIESFLVERSDLDFSHSICPDCAKKLYPDLKLSRDKS